MNNRYAGSMGLFHRFPVPDFCLFFIFIHRNHICNDENKKCQGEGKVPLIYENIQVKSPQPSNMVEASQPVFSYIFLNISSPVFGNPL